MIVKGLGCSSSLVHAETKGCHCPPPDECEEPFSGPAHLRSRTRASFPSPALPLQRGWLYHTLLPCPALGSRMPCGALQQHFPSPGSASRAHQPSHPTSDTLRHHSKATPWLDRGDNATVPCLAGCLKALSAHTSARAPQSACSAFPADPQPSLAGEDCRVWWHTCASAM